MIFFYIDESGTGLGHHQNPFFILVAAALPAREWKILDKKVTELKQQLISWAKPEDFEIKGREMRRGENYFSGLNWAERRKAFNQVAELIASSPCRFFAVRADKRRLPIKTGATDDLYRLAFWRLLEEVERELEHINQDGLLMLDARSDLHSSVQDRRLVDAYREWQKRKTTPGKLIELPWFGFSEFYIGLQLADFVAYLVDQMTQKNKLNPKTAWIHAAFQKIKPKVELLEIP